MTSDSTRSIVSSVISAEEAKRRQIRSEKDRLKYELATGGRIMNEVEEMMYVKTSIGLPVLVIWVFGLFCWLGGASFLSAAIISLALIGALITAGVIKAIFYLKD